MGPPTTTMPVVLIPDTTAGVLDYLVQRTADTVGEQVKRCQVIAVGKVQKVETRSMPVRPESISALQPWLTSDAGAHPQIVIQFTNMKVERVLVGARNLTRIDIAYPLAAARPLSADFVPIFNTEDLGLLFLRELPS